MNEEEIKSFYDLYRDSLDYQRDSAFNALKNARRNAHQNIMSSANTAGMMYSNFPERTKYQYDTNTYQPARDKIHSTYMTGLDTLRNNVIDTLNQIAYFRDETAGLNKISDQPNLPDGARLLNSSGDYVFIDDYGITQYRDKNNNNIRFGTSAKRAGREGNDQILDAAKLSLSSEEYQRLLDNWTKAQENGATSIIYNTGQNFQMPSMNYLEEAERDFLGSLGLNFE